MRRGLSVGLALGLMAGLAAVASGAVTTVGAAASCASTPIAIHHVVRPGDGVSLYTANEQEVTAAAAYGFTERLGVAFYAPRRSATRTWCRSTALRSHRLATSRGCRTTASSTLPLAATATLTRARISPCPASTTDASSRSGDTATARSIDSPSDRLSSRRWPALAGQTRVCGSTPAPPTAPLPTPEPPPPSSVGSLPVGQASYPVPGGAVHVAPWGDDNNPGSSAAPVRTLAHGDRHRAQPAARS